MPEAPPSPLLKTERNRHHGVLARPVTLFNLRQKTHSSSSLSSYDSLTRSPKKLQPGRVNPPFLIKISLTPHPSAASPPPPPSSLPGLKTSASDKKSMRPGRWGSGIGLQVDPGGAPAGPRPPGCRAELSATVSPRRSRDVKSLAAG